MNRRVDESSPMVDARLPTGERVNVIIPPLSLIGPFSRSAAFLDGSRSRSWSRWARWTSRRAAALSARARASERRDLRRHGAGKTTLLNALSSAILERERIVTIEEFAELQLQQRHVISLEARPMNVEARRGTIRDLVRNSLRMRTDRIIVGEVRASRRSTCSRR